MVKLLVFQYLPVIIWIIASIIIIVALRLTKWGRHLYALGGSRLSSSRLSISEKGYWIGAYVISGFFAALTGALLLGWSGGGFAGDIYLFTTIAAVVIGGTSLLGGLWRIRIKCDRCFNFTDCNNCTNWMGFSLSSTIYFRFINYTNGSSIR